MKTLTFKAFCFYEITDDFSKLPSVHATKTKCKEWNRSYFGHACDDPEKRGIIAECEVKIKLPPMIKATPQIRHYISHCLGKPAVLMAGNNEANKKEIQRAIREQRARLKKFDRLQG